MLIVLWKLLQLILVMREAGVHTEVPAGKKTGALMGVVSLLGSVTDGQMGHFHSLMSSRHSPVSALS